MKIEEYHDALHAIRYDLTAIEGIADLLYSVGLEKLADRLALKASGIRDNIKIIDEVISDDLSTRVKEAQGNTGTILKALISGIEITEKKNEQA